MKGRIGNSKYTVDQLQVLQVCAMMRSILSSIGPRYHRAPQASTSQRTPRYIRSIRSTWCYLECPTRLTRLPYAIESRGAAVDRRRLAADEMGLCLALDAAQRDKRRRRPIRMAFGPGWRRRVDTPRWPAQRTGWHEYGQRVRKPREPSLRRRRYRPDLFEATGGLPGGVTAPAETANPNPQCAAAAGLEH